MPRLFFTGLAVLAGLGLARAGLGFAIPQLHFLWQLLITISGSAVVAVVSISIVRGVILDQWADHFVWEPHPSFPFYFVCLAMIRLIWPIGMGIGHFFVHPGLIHFVFGLLSIFLYARTMLLLPAIAVDAPNASLRAAWRDSKGKVWRITRSFSVATLPVLVPAMIFAAAIIGGGGQNHPASPLNAAGGLGGVGLFAIFGTLAAIAMLMPVYAAVSATLYQNFAYELNESTSRHPPLFDGLAQPAVGIGFAVVLIGSFAVDRMLPPPPAHAPHAGHGIIAAQAARPGQPVEPVEQAEWVAVKDGALSDGATVADRGLPRNAIFSGNEDRTHAVCRVRSFNILFVGETSPGGCTVAFKGRDITMNTYDIAVGTGRWAAPGSVGAMTSGADYAIVCRADMWVRRPIAIASVAGDAPHKSEREDRGQHAGQLTNDGRCHFAYEGMEYTTASFEVFYR